MNGHQRADAESLVGKFFNSKKTAKPLNMEAVSGLRNVPIRDAKRTLGSIMAKGSVMLENSQGSDANITGVRRSTHMGLWNSLLESPPKTMEAMYCEIFGRYMALTPTLSYAQGENLRKWLGTLLPWVRMGSKR